MSVLFTGAVHLRHRNGIHYPLYTSSFNKAGNAFPDDYIFVAYIGALANGKVCILSEPGNHLNSIWAKNYPPPVVKFVYNFLRLSPAMSW